MEMFACDKLLQIGLTGMVHLNQYQAYTWACGLVGLSKRSNVLTRAVINSGDTLVLTF